MNKGTQKDVGLFVTCVVNTLRPSIGFATIKLLEDAGCKVNVPMSQSCCGQPAFNSGDNRGAKEIAKVLIEQFDRFDYVVAPSGSCAAMIKKFAQLFDVDDPFRRRASKLEAKTHELLSFLVDVCDYRSQGVTLDASYAYHHSCSGLRELNVYKQPTTLLQDINGLCEKELEGSTECCGFGGTFCVKYPNISNEIVSEKVTKVLATHANILLGGDWGCLMNIEGKISRVNSGAANQGTVSVMHTAEILAGMMPNDIDPHHNG